METYDILTKLGDVHSQISRLLAMANDIVKKEDERYGGYLTVLDGKTGKVIIILACGIISDDKHDKYLHFSQEKAKRLFAHKEHYTSFESMDEKQLMFPGAIRGEEAIYSFSGHQAEVDEAISIAMFYVLEPSCRNRLEFDGRKLFGHYYNVVAERNKFVRPFLDSARHWVGNIWMNSYFPR